MKLFRGRNLETTADWLRDLGWPARAAKRMAAFLTGDTASPPTWRELTTLPGVHASPPRTIGLRDALRDAGWPPEDVEAAGELDDILGGAAFAAPEPLSPSKISSEAERDPDTETGSVGTERSGSGTEGNGVWGRKNPTKSSDGD